MNEKMKELMNEWMHKGRKEGMNECMNWDDTVGSIMLLYMYGDFNIYYQWLYHLKITHLTWLYYNMSEQ